jgi:hypothetical protein
LQSALVQDDAWLVPKVHDELRSAVEESVRAIEESRRVGFILEIQTGTLLWLLAGIDDAAAAAVAERWLAVLPDQHGTVDPKVLDDILGALENGGPRCRALLEQVQAHHARQGS